MIVIHLNTISQKMQQNTQKLANLCQTPIPKLLGEKDIADKHELMIANDLLSIRNFERKFIDMEVLYNVNSYIKLAMAVCNYISVWQEARMIDALVKTE